MSRPGLIGPSIPILETGTLGYSTKIPTESVPPPPNLSDPEITGAIAYIPFGATSEVDFVQSAFNDEILLGSVTVTLSAPVSPGNLLVAFIACREAIGTDIAMVGSGWTLIRREFTGSEADNWPCEMYYRTAQVGDGASFTATKVPAAGAYGMVVVELSGVSGLGADVGSSNATSEPTISITPVTSDPVALISGVTVRSDFDAAFTPASGMTEVADAHFGGGSSNGPQVAVNYRIIPAPSGSYTIGSTYGGSSRRAVIGASFQAVANMVFWVQAFNVTDGDPATFDYVDVSIDEFLRVDMLGTYLVASAELRVALVSSGSKTIILQGANQSDFSDAVTLDTVVFTATGSYTADDVAFSWTPTTAYRFYQFALGTAEGVHPHEISLFGAPTSVTDHPALTGRSEAAQHPASSVTVNPSVAGETDVQAALEALESGGGGGSITVEEDGETPVTGVDHIVFDGATVTDDTGGQVTVTITPGGVSDITDLPTAETDTSKRLAPDGLGGVEWGAGASGIADQGAFTYLDATEGAAPGTPSSGFARIYAKSDGRIYSKDDAGVEYGPFDAAGSGPAEPALDMYGSFPGPAFALGSANGVVDLAYYLPVVIPGAMTAKRVWYVTGSTTTGAGNVCIAIYDTSFARLVTTGSVAWNQNNSNVLTTIDITDTALSAGVYYLGFAASSATNMHFQRFAPGTNGNVALGILEETSAFPLPATATPALPTTRNYVPMFGIMARTEF